MNKTTYLPCLHVEKFPSNSYFNYLQMCTRLFHARSRRFKLSKKFVFFLFFKTIQAKVNLEVQLVMSKGLGGVINQAHLIHDQSKGRSSTRLHQPPGGRSSMGTGFSWVGRTPCTRTFLHSLQPDRACAARVQA